MTTINTPRLFSYVLVMVASLSFLWSCGRNDSQELQADAPTVQKQTLVNEGTSLDLPASFFQLTKEEFLGGKGEEIYDQVFVEQFNELLTVMALEDPQLDIFVDSSDYESLLLFVGTNFMDLFALGNVLADNIEQQNNAKLSANPNLQISTIATTLHSGSGNSILRLKYKFFDAAYGLTNYRSFYFISTVKKTFVVHEFASTERDVYDFLWSLKHDE
jgi:hypothetical protein